MSTAIVRHEVSTIDDLQRVAKMLAMSNYFDAKAAGGDTAIAQIATKILAGAEMGYGPFASVQGIHVIQGKPVISANLMAAAVKRSGRYDYRVRRLDNEGCEIEFFQRTGDKPESIGKTSFTKDDAKAAGLLGKDNWSKFARNMYFARAMSNGIRFFCPDVFDGSAVYTPDELGADEDAEGNVIDVQPVVVTQEVKPADKPAAPQAANNSGGSQTSNGNGGGAAVEHTNGGTVDAKTMARRYQDAKGAAMTSGKFNGVKHCEAAWQRMFREYNAHDYANGETFLAAWAEYVADHAEAVKRGVEDVPAVADAEPIPA